MGENLDIDGRLAVRTPMQWSDQRNGGFSTADPDELQRPVTPGAYGPENVNVFAQRGDADSLLNFISLLIRRYRQSPELGWADLSILDQPHRSVLAHECRWDDRRMIALHNLSPEGRTVPLRLPDCDESYRLEDLLTTGHTSVGQSGAVELELEGYGYRWLRLMSEDSHRLA